MDALPKQVLEDILTRALEEDIGPGDVTTLATISPHSCSKAHILARQELVLAGAAVASEVFRMVDERLECEWVFSDGDRVPEDGVIARLMGPTASILIAERLALNFLGHLSGIATLTAQFVSALAGTDCRILDTRKTTPLLRALEKYAVRCGGGHNHRFGLYDAILIKDNHIAACGSIAAAVRRCRDAAPEHMRIEVEIAHPEEVEEAISAGAHTLLLDNMNGEQWRRSIIAVNGRAMVEVSGRMTPERAREAARAGADFVSVGALTHSALSADISLMMTDDSGTDEA